MHSTGFGPIQKTASLVIVFGAFLIIPLTLGIVALNQINRSGKQASAMTPAVVNKCDQNRDGQVNRTDLEIAAASFGQVKTGAGKAADIDSNGWVNSGDLLLISRNDPQRCLIQSSPAPTVMPSSQPSPGASAGCGVANNVVVDRNLRISHKGFAAGENIRIAGTGIALINVGTTQSSLGGTITQSLVLPPTLQKGTYRAVIVTRFPVVTFECGGFSVTPVPTPFIPPVNQ